mmetsp:Transcript_25606/g.37837  ORF Transcript_25606/g.37837 Transcript_25606/m.37837 type:complete len:430 (+) Transcript_25606:6471-7760(+)
MSGVILAIYANLERQERLLQYVQSIDVIPPELINPLERTLQAAIKFVNDNTEATVRNSRKLRFLISGLRDGYKHHSMNCITFKPGLRSICGFSLHHFTILLNLLMPRLKLVFPNCEVIAKDKNKYCEVRFKLFLTLFHLKMGVPYEAMSTIFGWCKSSIAQWCTDIRKRVIKPGLRKYRNILSTLGLDWQRQQATQWKSEHLLDGTYVSFKNRIRFQNNYNAQRGVCRNICDVEQFWASIGAVDGTYSITTRMELELNHEGETLVDDVMYSDYLGGHAYKLLVVTSHKDLRIGKKLIILVLVAPGNTADSVMWDRAWSILRPQILISGSVFLGDNAYHNCSNVIAPYAQWHMNTMSTVEKANATTFNSDHSRRRIDSENAIAELKEWASIRGRGDISLFYDQTTFEDAVACVLGLNNFRSMIALNSHDV